MTGGTAWTGNPHCYRLHADVEPVSRRKPPGRGINTASFPNSHLARCGAVRRIGAETAWLQDSHGQGSPVVWVESYCWGNCTLVGIAMLRRTHPWEMGNCPPLHCSLRTKKPQILFCENKICGFFYVPTCELQKTTLGKHETPRKYLTRTDGRMDANFNST